MSVRSVGPEGWLVVGHAPPSVATMVVDAPLPSAAGDTPVGAVAGVGSTPSGVFESLVAIGSGERWAEREDDGGSDGQMELRKVKAETERRQCRPQQRKLLGTDAMEAANGVGRQNE